jgi:hypothetical protein
MDTGLFPINPPVAMLQPDSPGNLSASLDCGGPKNV